MATGFLEVCNNLVLAHAALPQHIGDLLRRLFEGFKVFGLRGRADGDVIANGLAMRGDGDRRRPRALARR